MDYNKGDVFYVCDNEQTPIGDEIWANRPGLIISNDTLNKNSGIVMIVYLSQSINKKVNPTHIKIKLDNHYTMALCEQIHTVSKERLLNKIGTVSKNYMNNVEHALGFSLALNSSNHTQLFKKWENYIKKYNLKVQLQQESLLNTELDTTVMNLKNQIKILKKERDAYKNLVSAKDLKIDEIKKQLNL